MFAREICLELSKKVKWEEGKEILQSKLWEKKHFLSSSLSLGFGVFLTFTVTNNKSIKSLYASKNANR